MKVFITRKLIKMNEKNVKADIRLRYFVVLNVIYG